jgi:hypothetical protein
MKVAVCIHGQLRGDYETLQSINENLIEPNDADVFVHSWSYKKGIDYTPVVREDVKPLVDYTVKPHRAWTLDEQERRRISIENLSLISQIFQPKKFQIEEQIIFDATDYVLTKPQNLPTGEETSKLGLCTLQMIEAYQRVKSQNLTKMKSFNLIDDPGKYELIYFTRNDLLMNQKLNLESITPHRKGVFGAGDYKFFCDQWYYGDPESMSIVCDFYNAYDDILANQNNGHNAQHNEWHFGTHLNNRNLQIVNVPLRSYYSNNLNQGVKYSDYQRQFL